jgi:Transglutaminase-like superfamily
VGPLSKFVRLPGRDRLLLIQATALLALIRLGLRTLPFETLRKLLGRLARTGATRESGDAAGDRTVWAIEAAGRQFPGIGTCLTQALASHVLLGRRGCKANLRIGVARDSNGEFVAHAWLEKDGVVLIGAGEHRSYTPMPSLNGLDP